MPCDRSRICGALPRLLQRGVEPAGRCHHRRGVAAPPLSPLGDLLEPPRRTCAAAAAHHQSLARHASAGRDAHRLAAAPGGRLDPLCVHHGRLRRPRPPALRRLPPVALLRAGGPRADRRARLDARGSVRGGRGGGVGVPRQRTDGDMRSGRGVPPLWPQPRAGHDQLRQHHLGMGHNFPGAMPPPLYPPALQPLATAATPHLRPASSNRPHLTYCAPTRARTASPPCPVLVPHPRLAPPSVCPAAPPLRLPSRSPLRLHAPRSTATCR